MAMRVPVVALKEKLLKESEICLLCKLDGRIKSVEKIPVMYVESHTRIWMFKGIVGYLTLVEIHSTCLLRPFLQSLMNTPHKILSIISTASHHIRLLGKSSNQRPSLFDKEIQRSSMSLRMYISQGEIPGNSSNMLIHVISSLVGSLKSLI